MIATIYGSDHNVTPDEQEIQTSIKAEARMLSRTIKTNEEAFDAEIAKFPEDSREQEILRKAKEATLRKLEALHG